MKTTSGCLPCYYRVRCLHLITSYVGLPFTNYWVRCLPLITTSASGSCYYWIHCLPLITTSTYLFSPAAARWACRGLLFSPGNPPSPPTPAISPASSITSRTSASHSQSVCRNPQLMQTPNDFPRGVSMLSNLFIHYPLSMSIYFFLFEIRMQNMTSKWLYFRKRRHSGGTRAINKSKDTEPSTWNAVAGGRRSAYTTPSLYVSVQGPQGMRTGSPNGGYGPSVRV